MCIIIPTHWSKRIGGSQYQIKCLVENWAPKNYFDLILLCRNSNPGVIGTGYRLINFHGIDFFSRYGRLFDILHLYKALKKINPDIIYQKIGTAYAGAAALYAKNFKKFFALHIASDNDLFPINFSIKYKKLIPYFDKKVFDYGIRKANCVITQTRFQQTLLLKHFNIDTPFVVPNFAPIPEAPPPKENPIKVLWVANFKKLKQPEIFIKLSKDFGKIDSNVKFYMIGASAWDLNWNEKILKEIKETKNLFYLGSLPVNEVNDLFQKSHILINTSLYEGFSNTFIQAWFNEVPVISLNCDPDGLLGEKNVGLFCYGSYNIMFENLKRLIQDENYRIKMGKVARAYAKENHSLKNTNKILNLFLNS